MIENYIDFFEADLWIIRFCIAQAMDGAGLKKSQASSLEPSEREFRLMTQTMLELYG